MTKVEAPLKTGGDYLVTLSAGSDVGLRPGAELSVSRVKPPKYVGKLVVLLVNEKEAVARFVPPAGIRVGPDTIPKVDDVIVSK